MDFITHRDDFIDVNFTSLQGYLDVSYDDLCKVFGPHHTDVDDMKCDAGWDLMFEDGTVACIYNWKNGRNYLGSDGQDIKDITRWNIGGKSPSAAEAIEKVLKSGVKWAE